MRSFKLIQIGDIHFPEAKEKRNYDYKDHGFPRDLADICSPNPIQFVMRKILDIITNKFDSVLFTGDLTSYGDISGYINCLKYLKDSIFFKLSDPSKEISVVPGNHDINSSACLKDTSGIYDKFQPLLHQWQIINFDVLSVKDFRKVTIKNCFDCSANIYSINSCLGCWEKDYLPEAVRDKISIFRNEYHKDVDSKIFFQLFGVQLNTPAFNADDINKLSTDIQNSDNIIFPIVLSHHNILPQTSPRIEIYTELINSGFSRYSFLSCNRPIIYCHGHIHKASVEIVQHPDYVNSKLICISAPKLSNGFNVIDIQYNSQHIPLGCIIYFYDFSEGILKLPKEIRIPFHNYIEFEKTPNQDLLKIVNLVDKSGGSRFTALRDACATKLDRKPQIDSLANLLLEAEWFGFVKIMDRSADAKSWQIKRLL